MRSVLAQLELISAIPAAQPRSSAGTEHPGGRRPPGDTGHTRYADWYGPPFHECHGCEHTDEDRQEALEAAQAELKHLRHTSHVDPSQLETDEQRKARMLSETVNWTPEQVETSHWTYTRFQVRRYRLIDGRDSETGQPSRVVDDDETAPERAKQLAAKGMSSRQIALILGKHQTQIQRYLKRAA